VGNTRSISLSLGDDGGFAGIADVVGLAVVVP
jgi:hypothetical protein